MQQPNSDVSVDLEPANSVHVNEVTDELTAVAQEIRLVSYASDTDLNEMAFISCDQYLSATQEKK